MNTPLLDIYVPSVLTDLQMQALHVYLATVSAWLERRRPFARRNQRHHDYEREQRELLLLQLQLWQDEQDDPCLRDQLAQLQMTIQQKVHLYWHVGITDGRQMEASYPITTAVRPFSVDLQAFEPLDWDDGGRGFAELASLFKVLGVLPQYRIQIAGFLENPEDHLLCAYMGAEITRQYQAFARVRLQPQFHTARAESAWTPDQARELARSLAGRTWEIFTGVESAYFLLDDEALQNWAEHPRFFLHNG